MRDNFLQCLKLVLVHEAGYVNHPRDPGGATNRGITIATYRRYINPRGTAADLRHITEAEVERIYRFGYWDAVKGDRLPYGVDYAVFDYAVNSGPGKAIRHLQEVIGADVDGLVGPQTLAKVAEMKPEEIIKFLCTKRMKFLQGLATYDVFGRGWSRRVRDVQKHALKMVPKNNEPVIIKPDAGIPETEVEASRRSVWEVLWDLVLKLFGRV